MLPSDAAPAAAAGSENLIHVREPTDEELLQSPRAEDFGAFYRRHVRGILGWLMRQTRDPEAAADLTAETFAAALVARRRFAPERASAQSWLYGIATHKLRDWQRRGYAEDRARRRLGMERLELTDTDIAEIEYHGGDVGELVASLPTDQGAAVTARVVEERSYAEIAGALEVPEAAVRKRVSRGLAELRRRLGGDR